jgi:hypothetical protein
MIQLILKTLIGSENSLDNIDPKEIKRILKENKGLED